jgi:hypothetical protein
VRPLHVLLDYDTKAVLTASAHASVIIELRKFVSNCIWVADIQRPNYLNGTYPFSVDQSRSFEMWSWDGKTRSITKTDPARIDAVLSERSALITAQRNAFVGMMHALSLVSARAGTGIDHQDAIYAQKLAEAHAVKSGSDKDALRWYPYVVQHAEYASLTLEQAADDIIFASKLAHDILIRVEGMRLKYYKLIREARSIEDVANALSRFGEEMHHNALQ